jgi:hypothetical protein
MLEHRRHLTRYTGIDLAFNGILFEVDVTLVIISEANLSAKGYRRPQFRT